MRPLRVVQASGLGVRHIDVDDVVQEDSQVWNARRSGGAHVVAKSLEVVAIGEQLRQAFERLLIFFGQMLSVGDKQANNESHEWQALSGV